MSGASTPIRTGGWPRVLTGIGLFLILLLMGLYLVSGRLIAVAVMHLAKSDGIELRELQVDRPGIGRWSIPQINGSAGALGWTLSNVELTYHWRGLLNGQLHSVDIESIDLKVDEVIAPAPKSNNPHNSAPMQLTDHLAPEYWLQRLPWRELDVEAITLDLPVSQTTLSGELQQRKKQVRFNSHIKNADLNLEHDLVVTYNQSNGLTINLSRSDPSTEQPTPLLSVSSQFGANSLDLSLQASLADEDAQEFAAIVGRPDVALTLLGSAKTTLPWPLPEGFGWDQLDATGNYSLSVFAPNPAATQPPSEGALTDLRLSDLSGEFRLREKLLELQLTEGLFSIAQSATSNTTANKATCGVEATVTARVEESGWTMSDGIRCVLEGSEKLQLNLQGLAYRTGQDAQTTAAQELDLRLGYVGEFNPLGKPLTADGELDVRIRQTGTDQVAGSGTLGVRSSFLQERSAQDSRTGTTLPFRFDYWPNQLRGRAEFDHSFQLGERVFANTVQGWQDNIDVSGGRLQYKAEIDWQDGNYSARLQGEFSEANVVNPLDAPAGTLELRPLSGSYALSLNNDSVSATGTLLLASITLPYKFDYSLQTGAGRLQSTFNQLLPEAVFSKLFRNWAEPYDLVSGQLHGELLTSFKQELPIQTTSNATLSNATLSYEDYTVSGIAGDFDIEMIADRLVVTSPNLRANTLDVGFPITEMRASLYYEDKAGKEHLTLNDTGARLLGGQASVPTIRVDLPDLDAQFDTQLTGLSLTQILALEGEDIQGSGIIEGTLPVQIDDGEIQIRGGLLASVSPGGEINLSEDFASLTGQPGLDFALRALNDFSYDSLLADVSYAPDGDLELGVSLQGSNPVIEQGRRIHYNLTVTENVLALLESLQADRIITDRVEQRINAP